jgi:SAM-dependent methyltransferase
MSAPSRDRTVGPATSRSERDRALFDAAANRYCEKDLLPASRRARRHRLERTLRSLPLSSRTSLLEIGCGAGFAAGYLRGRFGRYVGLDPSEQLIRLARHYNAGPGISFHRTALADFECGERFDAAFMIGVLHHLEDPDAAVQGLVDLLEPGGWLAVNEPQPANPLVSAARRVRKRLHSDYSDEQEEIARDQLHAVFERAGLADIRITPQGVFSTPFAEVVLRPGVAARALSALTCSLDTLIEETLSPLLGRVSWNLIAVGRRPKDLLGATEDEAR